MERNLYDDDELEDFLKQKADQYKIYPSDKVWSGIYIALHTGRRWHIAGGALLLIAILTLITLEKKLAPENKKISRVIASPIAHYARTTGSIEYRPITRPALKKRLPSNNTTTKTNTIATSQEEETNFDDNAPLAIVIPESEAAIAEDKNNEIQINALMQRAEDKAAVDKKEAVQWREEEAISKLSPAREKLLNIQFYLSPTISYRRWQSGDLNATQNNIISRKGIKGLVDQTPALGVELGSALQVHVAHNLLVKTGLQLNYVRYNINAYRSSPEKTSITLSSSGYYNNPTTITTYSTLRNFSGSFPETIQNQYIQLSLPAGAEWKVIGNKRLQLNVAGSVQPTYLLMNNAYMLTSDFSNYTKASSLVRRWNVNAGIETFVSFYSAGVRWQIGPQFRYQLLSSYTNRYPIHEYLVEYGMKIGVSKTIR